ncbi:charged multivesicular body protein 4 [Blastomyces parvus]|uniref:Vacuolar-sorting protein SNF7 n=1 Tax=Blastomyces parvus TaxID=2060905 RepID=A0A2B7WM10_9EURO|nr:charged multivesicular body protein 4 [Blastomyces parvus]
MWSSWFGGQSSQQQRKDVAKNAILSLRQQLDMLQKREKHLHNQIEEQDGIARKHVATNKNAAKSALRRKKGYAQALENTAAQIFQLEQQIYSLEAANINQETLNAMKNAGDAMKQIHKGLTIEKVDDIMDHLREQQELGQEIVTAITNASGPIDDAELEEELDSLAQEKIDEQLLKSGPVPIVDRLDTLPAAANGPLKGKERATEIDDEEEELEKLRAEMAM